MIRIVLLVLLAFQLVSCERYDGKKNRLPDIQYRVDLKDVSKEIFVSVAADYAAGLGMDVSGPYQRFNDTGEDYTLTADGEFTFNLTVVTLDKIASIYLFCSYTLPLDQARKQLSDHAEQIYTAYKDKFDGIEIRNMKLEGSSWFEDKPGEIIDFTSISTCENIDKT